MYKPYTSKNIDCLTARTTYLVCFISTVTSCSKKEKKPIMSCASSGHLTKLKQSIFAPFDIYGINSGTMLISLSLSLYIYIYIYTHTHTHTHSSFIVYSINITLLSSCSSMREIYFLPILILFFTEGQYFFFVFYHSTFFHFIKKYPGCVKNK